MANETLNTAMGSISAAVATVVFFGTVWKFLTDKYQFEDKLKEFNKRKDDLKRFRDGTETTIRNQLRVPGKVVRKDVIDWLEAVRVEMSDEQSVEYLVKQKGILSLFYRTGIVKTRIADLNRTIESGDRICQVSWLVEDDASLERFTKQKKKLEAELRDVKARLTSQLLVPGKTEAEKVKLWRGKVEEITGQTATDIEAKFNGRVPQEPEFPDLVIKKIREMEELCNEGTQLPESLTVDDFSKTLGDDEKKSFGDWKEKLRVKHRDVKEKLSTERCQNPEKIVAEQVEKWLQRVDVIIPAASDVHNQLNSGDPPYLAILVNRVNELIQEMKKLCDEGDQLPESLVVDDYSQTLSDDEMQKFEEWKEKLQGKYKDVERMLQSQHGFGKIEVEQVKIWKKQVEKTTASAAGVQNQLDSGPPHTAPLVRGVKKLIQKMEKLHDEGCKLPESLVLDDPSASAPPLLTSELQGNHDVKEEILRHLMGDETSKIGVWGMGGVGKTTIMKHVYNQLRNESKFKKVIWVTGSQPFDVRRIQQEIAISLQEEKNLPNHQEGDLRAAALSKMLEMHKPYVLILDDVWERFELYEVGLPEIFDDGSKLVLTTRSELVARVMDCERVKVNTLPWEESLKLFKDTAGVEALSDDGGAEGTLEEMVHECGGLPLAIKTVAASMKGEVDPCLWRVALKQLKQGRRNVAGSENDQFRVLKFSYDRLGNTRVQHCFLHCALFPEDAMIPTEDLIDYWIDGDLIDVEGTSQDMKDEGHDILNKLVGNCLLEFVRNRSGRDCARMHDLMRDMAIDITRSSGPRFLVKAGVGLRELPEDREWEEDLSKVSLMSNDIEDIPSSMPSPRCPILTTLLLSKNYNLSTIPEHFFEHMPQLKVLDLSYNEELRSLPSSVSKLVKLTKLLLRRCGSLKELPSLSNLTALKKLDLYGAGLEEVPDGLEMLLNLKYLDIRRSSGDRVPTGWKRLVSEILPNLFKLQHLALDPTVPVEGGQLGGILTKLENFYGGFRTLSDMSIFLSKRQKSLYHYNIYVGNPNNPYNDNDISLKYINIYDINIRGEPGSIPSDVQRLKIRRCNDVRSLNAISGFQEVFDLQRCEIRACREVEYVFSGLNKLSKFKKLELWDLENWKGLFDSEAAAPPLAVFSSLEEISIGYCPKIKKLFPTTLQYLPNLKDISIDNCSQLEEIMVASSEEEGRVIHAKLEKLSLIDLPMLRSISSLTVASVFDSLKELSISRCRNVEYVFRGQFIFNSLKTLEKLKLEGLHNLKSVFHEEADESLTPLSGTEAVSFRLKVLRVEDCPQLKNIFPHAMQVGSFQNIERIVVKGCDLLEDIMSASSETEEDQSKPFLPKLKYLSLIELPVLRRICSALLVPDSLQELTIEDCPNLSWESLFGLHVELPRKLFSLSLEGVRNLESVFDEEASDSLAFWRLPPAATTSFACQTITVGNCPQLKRIFSHAGLLDYFQNMQKFVVSGCDELEEIISSKPEEEPQKLTRLPNLEEFNLCNLPKLKKVCNGTSALICDCLVELTISGCTELRRFPLHFSQSENGQLSPPPYLWRIILSDKEKEWWESLEWDQPNAKAVLSPLCIFKWKKKYQFSWTPPSPGYLKLNVGACKSQTQIASAGGLIRDSNGSWIRGFMVHLGDASVVTAELWGIRTGLAIARSLNITHLIVETNSTFVVNKLTSSTNMPDPDFTLINDYLGFRLCFKSCRVRQARREVNVCADYLANEALLMPQGITYLENPPEGFRTLLWKDATGKSATHSSEEDFPGHRPFSQKRSSSSRTRYRWKGSRLPVMLKKRYFPHVIR